MKGLLFKWLLVTGLLISFQITDIMTVNANEESLINSSRQLQKTVMRDLDGGSENSGRELQQPVDLRILQQRYPDIFFLQGPTDDKRVALTFDDGPDPRFSNDVLDVLKQYVIGWSVDSLDWQEDPPEVIASTVLDIIHPGAIILMHDGAESDGDRTNTIESLHLIIPALQEQGYEFVTVPELLTIPYKK